MEFDELTNKLGGSTIDDEELRHNHPRFSDYKNIGKIAEQQRLRREEHLNRRTENRQEKLEQLRNFCKDVTKSQRNPFQRRVYPKKNYKNLNFDDELMQSDWLVDIPMSLSTEWIMMPSPVGKRCMVVANNGMTLVFDKRGHIINRFHSILPGGEKSNGTAKVTMLDCIHIRNTKQFYALDLICWNSRYMVDSDFNCRRFMLTSKLEEDIDMHEMAKPEAFKFSLLPICSCSPEEMTKFMQKDFNFELDGLLFYYTDAPYIQGQTPLVGWLKPWMLPEILSIQVPQNYLENVEYSSSREFIKEFNMAHNFKSSAEKNQECMDEGADSQNVEE